MKLVDAVSNGWPVILCSLKSLLETGEALEVDAALAGGRVTQQESPQAMAKFKPKTVYVTYIAATPEKVWQALTSAEFTRKYFWERSVEIEAKRGGRFALILPDGRVNVKGKVIEYDPPRKLVVTLAG